jgi:hypothetical protein
MSKVAYYRLQPKQKDMLERIHNHTYLLNIITNDQNWSSVDALNEYIAEILKNGQYDDMWDQSTLNPIRDIYLGHLRDIDNLLNNE